MSKTIRNTILLFLFLLTTGTGISFAENNYATDTLVLDRGQEKIWKREISPELIEEYRQMPEYTYDLGPVEQETFWQRLKRWIGKWFIKLLNVLGFLWYLRYILIGGLFVLFIVLVMKGSLTGLFRPKKAVLPMNFSTNEDPTQTNWENLIEEALQKKEYRLATRFYFLQLLKQLSASGWIRWKSEKTNRDYHYEIKEKEIRINFQDLTRLYEAVWYGNFPLQEEDFDQIREDFTSMKNILVSKEQSRNAS